MWSKIFGASARNQRYGGDLNLKESLKALKYLPPFLIMIWETNKAMTVGNVLLRLIKSGIPVSSLYVGKLIIDEVLRLSQTDGGDLNQLWVWVGLEFALALLLALLSRAISLLDALLGDLFSNETSVRLIEHAAKMDLPLFEDSTFYDKLERARRQTVSRTMLLSQLLMQVEGLVTIIFLELD